MAKHDLQSALRTLLQKSEVRVYQDQSIEVLNYQSTVGNGGWAKIDFLKKCHGFRVDIVDKFRRVSAREVA